MSKRVLLSSITALLLAAVLIPAAMAAPATDTIIGEGETVTNSITVLDGDLIIHEGATVLGDVAVFNGDVFIDGQILGNIILFNGDLEGGEDAYISGDCVLLNGSVTSDGENSSLAACNIVKGSNLSALGSLAPGLFQKFENAPEAMAPELQDVPEIPDIPELPDAPEFPEVLPTPYWDDDFHGDHDQRVPYIPESRSRGFNIFARVSGVVASSVLFGILGLLAGLIMPENLRRITGAAREATAFSGMAGVLTAIAVPSLIVLLIPLSIVLTLVCIGLLGFPIMFLLALGLVAGVVLGWIAVGTWLGLRLFGRGKDAGIARAAALGTGLLTFITGAVGLVTLGCGSWALGIVFSAIGLGAVALTQFGMKPYPRRPGGPVRPDAPVPPGAPDPDKLDTVLGTLPPDEITIP